MSGARIPPQPAATPISGARALALVLVGLGMGVLGTVVALTALTQRASYGDGLMAVLQAELAQLRQQARRGDACEPGEVERARSRLALLAADIPRAFPAGGSAMQQMSAELGSAVAATTADCQALSTRLSVIDQSCQTCHTQFR